jgi:hypothetical protein
MFGTDARHKVFKGRVNNVWLERPDDLVLAWLFIIAVRMNRSQQSREARVGYHYKMLARMLWTHMLQKHRSKTAGNACMVDAVIKLVGLADKKESAASASRQVADSCYFTGRTPGGQREAFDYQRAQIILQNYILKVSM